VSDGEEDLLSQSDAYPTSYFVACPERMRR
jgi:hypothetical protein